MKTRGPRAFLWILATVWAAVALLLSPVSSTAHEIPATVTIQTYLRAEGDILRMLVRVPLGSMRDIQFPLRGPGYINIADADPFMRDAAVLWLVDYIQDVIHGPKGPVPTIAVEDVITTDVSFVDTAAVYGVRVEGIEIPVAAITIKLDMKFDPVALRSAVVKQLPTNSRPIVIRVINDLPVTAGHRTRKSALRSAGLGFKDASGETLWLEPKQDRYVPLSSDALAALIASL